MRTIYPQRINTFPPGYVVRNQGRGNKCPAYTLGNCWDILRARAALANPGTLLPGAACMDAIYYYARRVQGTPGDIGAHFWHLQSSLAQYGVPTGVWSDMSDMSFANAPPQSVADASMANRPISFNPVRWISSGPSKDSVSETVSMALSEGRPLPAIIMLSSSFWDIYHQSSLLDARYRYDPNDKRGEHAVLITGVDQANGVYELLNSYGPDWGYQGRFTMDYDQFGGAVTQIWDMHQSRTPTVPEFSTMSNPAPASITSASIKAYFARTGQAQSLAVAFESGGGNNWQALLNKAAEFKMPATVVEILANLPKNTIEHYVNTGAAVYPAELFDAP